ncbi:hypothetical protein F4782DRAFT_500022 [Xylaria castorea]|nr:hypothetical protein F4782DRAFT_500022 [Xylaria castorea]
MPSNPEYPYSLGLNITAWVLQLPACLYFLYDTVAGLPLVETTFEYGNVFLVSIMGIGILINIFINLSTIASDIAEIVKIARKRMPLALYLKYTSRKTIIYAIYVVTGLVFGSRVLIVVGGIMSITSFMQLIHGVQIGIRMRKDGVPMTAEYELILNPASADHLEAGYGEPEQPPAYEAELSTSSEDNPYANSLPPKGNCYSKP